MDDRSLLNELAHEVKESEREELLKKLRGRAPKQETVPNQTVSSDKISAVPDFESREGRSEERIHFLEQKYEKLSLVQKVLVFFRQIFKRVDFSQAVESTLMDNLRNSLSASPNPMISQDGFSVTNFFVDQVALLNESLNQLKTFVNTIDGIGDPGEFYFFAFEELFPDTFLKFRNSITLSHFITEDVNDVSVIRTRLNDEFNRFITQFPPQAKERLHKVASDLQSCQKLVGYPFRNLINKLILNRSASSISAELKDLSYVFTGFSVKNDCDFFSLLVSYVIKKSDRNDKLNRIEMMSYLNSLLTSIEKFRKIVPVDDLAAFALKDSSFPLRKNSAARDDWFLQFKNCISRYRDRLQEKYGNLVKLNNIIVHMKSVYKIDIFPYLRGYVNEVWSEVGVHVIFEKTLAFCKYFISSQMNGISAVVKPMLAEGMFYKQENKTALSNVYNKTRSTLEYINEIEKMFSKNGSIFKNLRAACSLTETEVLNSNSGFLHNILDMKEIDISREIQEFIVNLDVLEKLFTGFLYGESSESYDTISNLKSFKTVNNKEFIDNSKKLIESVRVAKTILADFYNIEKVSLEQ